MPGSKTLNSRRNRPRLWQPLETLISLLVCTLLILFVAAEFAIIVVPCSLFLLIPHQIGRQIFINSMKPLKRAMLGVCPIIFEYFMGVRIVLYGDLPIINDESLIICNHRSKYKSIFQRPFSFPNLF